MKIFPDRASHIHLFLGLALFLLSYSSFFINRYTHSAKILHLTFAVFQLGVILICEYITLKIERVSLLREIFKKKSRVIVLLIFAGMCWVLLDGIAKWLGKLYIYPYLSPEKYFLLIPVIAFAVYIVTIAESYLAVKAIFDKRQKGKKLIGRYFKYEYSFYGLLGFIGASLIMLVTVYSFSDYLSQPKVLFSLADVNRITGNYQVNYIFLFGLFLGIWFVFEFFEFYLKRSSLLKDILHGYRTPLYSILAGSFVLAVTMEMQNFTIGLWQYVNVPYQNFEFLRLPLVIWLSWPLQYVAFLSLFRIITDRNFINVWQGDVLN